MAGRHFICYEATSLPMWDIFYHVIFEGPHEAWNASICSDHMLSI